MPFLSSVSIVPFYFLVLHFLSLRPLPFFQFFILYHYLFFLSSIFPFSVIIFSPILCHYFLWWLWHSLPYFHFPFSIILRFHSSIFCHYFRLHCLSLFFHLLSLLILVSFLFPVSYHSPILLLNFISRSFAPSARLPVCLPPPRRHSSPVSQVSGAEKKWSPWNYRPNPFSMLSSINLSLGQDSSSFFYYFMFFFMFLCVFARGMFWRWASSMLSTFICKL